MKEYYIYQHIFPNGKSYIGMTKQKVNRRSRKNGEGYKLQPLLLKAIEKYGWQNVEHKILESGLSKIEAQEKEYEYINKYKTNKIENGYNIANGGHDSKSFAESTKKKISESHSNIKFTQDRKKKISEALKGRKLTEEHKAKIGKIHKGNNYRLGKMHNERTKELISEKLKEYYRIHGSTTGYKHTKETKQLLSRLKSGKENPKKWKPVIQYDINNNKIKEYESLKEAGKELNITNTSNIIACCKGKLKTAYGYRWKYKEV